MAFDFKNIVIGLYHPNVVISEAYLSLLEQFNTIEPEFHEKSFLAANSFFDLVAELNLQKLFISNTSSNSLFFRFSTYKSEYEFKFEIFYDYDQYDTEDVESTLHVYKNNEKLKSYFGSTVCLFDIVLSLVRPAKIYVIEYDNVFKTQPIFSGIQELPVSQNPNPYFQPRNHLHRNYIQKAQVV